jgi:signal transduction histidine kinase
VLHNVGNVLNSVNVAGKVLEDLATQSSVVLINRISDLLKAHEQDWMTFLSEDPKGQKILPFLTKVGPSLVAEQQTFLKELQGLQRHLSHVRHIILSHQEMARAQGQVKPVAIADLLEQALELSFHPGDARWVTIQRDFSPVPPVLAEEHQVLQILVNLFRNAKQAMQQHDQPRHTLTLSVRPQIHELPSQVAVSIQDTGMGIAPEHVSCLFRRGFTTKKDGNGIGLHSSAMTLEKLGGSLSVQSAGVGLGATFTLTIPVAGEDDASGG